VRTSLCPAVNVLTQDLNPFSYPIALSIVGVPLSVTRWLGWASIAIPSWAVLLSAFIFDLSGLINVLLFIYTRHGLFFRRETEVDLPVLDSVHDTEESAEG
jgi:hypothetical protein